MRKILIASAFFALLFSWNTPAEAARPCICPAVHAPVCAVKRGSAPKTYGNACRARCEGARVIHKGACRRISCKNIRCLRPKSCRMIFGKPRCICPKIKIRCPAGTIVAWRVVNGCRMPYCRRVISCKNIRCLKPKTCRMFGSRPVCVCPPVKKIRCRPGTVFSIRVINGCKVSYCRPVISCANIRCLKPKTCRMILGKPRCVCPKIKIRCPQGTIVAWRVMNGCKIPYCRRVISCKNIRCLKPKTCRMIFNRPQCVCPPVVKMRCRPGTVFSIRVFNGCKVSYCRPVISCKNIRCKRPKTCRMIFNRPQCVCPPVVKMRCRPGTVFSIRVFNGCKVSYCRPVLSCKNIRCKRPKTCRMIFNRPQCVCPPVKKIMCKPGYTLAFKVIGGCRFPYCVKKPCVCTKIGRPVCARKGRSVTTYGNPCMAKCAGASILYFGRCCHQMRCPKPRMCRVQNRRSSCACPKLAIKCQRGYITVWKTINGCRIPSCIPGCAVIRCAKYNVCRVVNGKAGCYCGKRICRRGQTCRRVKCIRAPCPPMCMR